MEKTADVSTVLLLDDFGEESRMLYESMRASGFEGPVIVIEDNGFYPEDVISVYQFFCGKFEKSTKVPGKPRYFNQINVPDFWEISGNNSNGKVHDKGHERGRIFYAEPKEKRLVRVVDWLDERGIVRFSDHYNRCGALYARTFFSKEGKKFCRTYYDAEGREVLYENYVTGDYVINRNAKVLILKNKVDLVKMVLRELGHESSRIFYNSLSTPFLVSEQSEASEKKDILFWQENERPDIPGNMQIIIEGKARHTANIYVQKRQSYQKLTELGVPKEVVEPLGFIHRHLRDNTLGKEILICTNSDQIEKCEELVRELPEFNFHIAAITEMSPTLLKLGSYENVHLYPGARARNFDELFASCDFYLDINHGNEIVTAIKRAYENDQLILGFESTLHNRLYTAPENSFTDIQELIRTIRILAEDEVLLIDRLNQQKYAAMEEDALAYQKVLR